MTKAELEQLKLAKSFSPDILAKAAIHQAKRGRLSEAQALDIATIYGEASNIARTLRSRIHRRPFKELI